MKYSPNQQRYSWWLRGAFGALGAALISLLVVAFFLSPDERGYGTHEQLRLAPCGVQRIFGFRCPSCGMTTSWAHLTKGQVAEALAANVGGVLLAIAAAVAGPWLLIVASYGRWWGRKLKRDWSFVRVALGLMVIIVAEWAVRVLFF